VGLDNVGLGGDDGVKKWSEELWADAVFALGVKIQALRRGWARYKSGPFSGKISVIAEIIDHNRVCISPQNAPRNSLISTQAIIDGPTTGIPRQSYAYKHLILTPLKLSGLPRGADTKKVHKEVEKEAIVDNGTSQVGHRSGSRCRRDGR